MSVDLGVEVERLFQQTVKEFLEWAGQEWIVTDRDRSDEVFGQMSDESIKSYNAGIASMRDAFAVWTEEYLP